MGERVEYYDLDRVTIEPAKPGEFRIATAALVTCGLCARTISGMGGPGHGSICIPCGDALVRGELRGAVKWDAPSQGDKTR